MTDLLYSILSIPSESGNQAAMQEFITAHCEEHGYAWRLDAVGNIYVTKGAKLAGTFPCVVAHLDTVHAIKDGGICPVEIDGKVTGINPLTMEQTGIGGDDKCGIYAALVCLASLPVCKAAFFVDEEIGCRGSSQADISFFRNARFVLQADRRGSTDFVTDIGGPLASKAFAKAVLPFLRSHGFSPCSGMMTDVEALRDGGVGISVANMSAGYYNPHQACEFIVIADLDNTIALMVAICGNLGASYPFQYEPPVYVPPAPRIKSPFPDYAGKVYPAPAWEDSWDDYRDGEGRAYSTWEDYKARRYSDEDWLLSEAAEKHLAEIEAEYGLNVRQGRQAK